MVRPNEREAIEADVFDREVLGEMFRVSDADLQFDRNLLNKHIGLTSPPRSGYKYALYQLEDNLIRGQKVLNIACGTGYESIILAAKGAQVVAFDISPVSVELSKRRAAINQVSDKIHTEVMSVYDLKFPDETFNFIYGNACLHHFDIDKAMSEVSRVLRKSGKAVFAEPFGESDTLQRIRDLIPIRKNKVSPLERQLTHKDINLIRPHFKDISVKEFGLFIRLERVIPSVKVLRIIEHIDWWLLEQLKCFRRYASSIVITAVK